MSITVPITIRTNIERMDTPRKPYTLNYAIGELQDKYHYHMGNLARLRADSNSSTEDIEEEGQKAEAFNRAIVLLTKHIEHE